MLFEDDMQCIIILYGALEALLQQQEKEDTHTRHIITQHTQQPRHTTAVVVSYSVYSNNKIGLE